MRGTVTTATHDVAFITSELLRVTAADPTTRLHRVYERFAPTVSGFKQCVSSVGPITAN